MRAAASGIVLAGGRAQRFGRDKLAEPLDDRPLLHHAIRALATVCREVIVVGPVGGLDPLLPRDVAVPVQVVADPRPFARPLVGLGAGAERASESLVVVVGGDMPWIEPAVIRTMLRRLADSDDTYRYDVEHGVALELGGQAQPLPLVLDRNAAVSAAADLAASGTSSLRGLINALTIAVVPEAAWRGLDPEGRTLRDVDRPGDMMP